MHFVMESFIYMLVSVNQMTISLLSLLFHSNFEMLILFWDDRKFDTRNPLLIGWAFLAFPFSLFSIFLSFSFVSTNFPNLFMRISYHYILPAVVDPNQKRLLVDDVSYRAHLRYAGHLKESEFFIRIITFMYKLERKKNATYVPEDLD